MGSNLSNPVDKMSKSLDIKTMTEDELLRWKIFIDHELFHRNKKRLVNVNLGTSKTRPIEVTLLNFRYQDEVIMHIPIPETTQSNGELLNLLKKLNETITSIFTGQYYSNSSVCFGLFGSYLKQRCDDQTTLGLDYQKTDRERFEFVGVCVLDFIEELGINPNSFCPLQIELKGRNAKLVFTGNRKYELVL